MASPLSLRLDENTRRRLERIARSRKVPASRILREAISRWIEAEEGAASPYEAAADLLGAAHGGDAGLSGKTGRRFAELLKNRRREP
jgi:predicted transcriptional regulator